MNLSKTLVDKVIKHVNRKNWWHVPPGDPRAYEKRGKFLASSFAEAEFWGRPLDTPLKIQISRPLVGDETTIEKWLFGRRISSDDMSIERHWALDAKMKKAALTKGYDSIVLMAPRAFWEFKKNGKLPRSVELNILNSELW